MTKKALHRNRSNPGPFLPSKPSSNSTLNKEVPCTTIENCHRQSKRWFMRVYALYMDNGWALRYPSNEHLGY